MNNSASVKRKMFVTNVVSTHTHAHDTYIVTAHAPRRGYASKKYKKLSLSRIKKIYSKTFSFVFLSMKEGSKKNDFSSLFRCSSFFWSFLTRTALKRKSEMSLFSPFIYSYAWILQKLFPLCRFRFMNMLGLWIFKNHWLWNITCYLWT